MRRETNKAMFESLPLEVHQAILCAIPDFETLQTTIRTAPCLYSAFMDARKHIVTNVLEHHIDPGFMYDAAMTEMTSKMEDPFTDTGVLEFLAKFKARDQSLFHSAFHGTISQAICLAELHDVVKFFISDFASCTLQHKEEETGIPLSRLLSWHERNRIGRSFYRFEIFYNIFRSQELYTDPHGVKVKDRIIPDDYDCYDFFLPWENEQLACIRDYLFRTISPVFDDVAMNIPSYTAFFASIDLYNTKQGYLEQGLRYVRRIMQAETINDRYNLIQTPLHGEELLNDSLQHVYSALCTRDQTTGKLLPDAVESLTPWYADFEGGPRAAWYWAYTLDQRGDLCGSMSQTPLREWGYVMWDKERLEALVDFSKPWKGRDANECWDEEVDKREEDKEKYRNRARYFVSQNRLSPDYFFESY